MCFFYFLRIFLQFFCSFCVVDRLLYYSVVLFRLSIYQSTATEWQRKGEWRKKNRIDPRMNNAARIQYTYKCKYKRSGNNHSIASNSPHYTKWEEQSERERKKTNTHNHTTAECWHFNHSNNKLHQTHTRTHQHTWNVLCILWKLQRRRSMYIFCVCRAHAFNLIQVKRI